MGCHFQVSFSVAWAENASTRSRCVTGLLSVQITLMKPIVGNPRGAVRCDVIKRTRVSLKSLCAMESGTAGTGLMKLTVVSLFIEY